MTTKDACVNLLDNMYILQPPKMSSSYSSTIIILRGNKKNIPCEKSIKVYYCNLQSTLQKKNHLICIFLYVFVLLEWCVRWELGDHTPAVFWGITPRICSKQLIEFLCSCHVAFSLCILLASMWCIPIVVLT